MTLEEKERLLRWAMRVANIARKCDKLGKRQLADDYWQAHASAMNKLREHHEPRARPLHS